MTEKNTPTDKLTSGELLARNTFLNLFGHIAPLVVALFTVPLIVKGLGAERFGVLTMVWVLIGYLSLLDLGLSRSLTKIVAEKLGEGRKAEVPEIVWTGVAIMLFFSMVLMVVVNLLLPWLVLDVLNIPSGIETETLNAFYFLITCSPVVILSIGFRGVLDAYQRFDLTNAVRIPLGIYSFFAPLAVLPFSKSVFPVVCVLVTGRIIAFLVHMIFCFRIVPGLGSGLGFQRSMVGPLIHLGGWISVSNIISPIMVYMDRFIIGAVISAAAVAYYAIPNEFVTKLLIVPGALIGVLFPAFSSSFTRDRNRTVSMFGSGVKYIFLVLFPVILVIITLAGDGLDFWLGREFSQNSTRVLQWLAVGVFFNSLANIPFTLIQGSGRADLTALLHFVELPFYLAGLWWMIANYGIEGAAIAWVARITVDTLSLFTMAYRLLDAEFLMIRGHLFSLGLAIAAFAASTVPTGIPAKGIFLLISSTIFILVTWRSFLSPEERIFLRARFTTMPRFGGRQ